VESLRLAKECDLSVILKIMLCTAWDKGDYLKRQLNQQNIVVAEQSSEILGFVVWNHEFASLPFI
jgi:hypothetical protein